MSPFIVVKAHPSDTHFDWYIIDLATRACVEMVSGGYDIATTLATLLERNAS